MRFVVPVKRCEDRRDLPGWRLLLVAALSAVSLAIATSAVQLRGDPMLVRLVAGAAAAACVVGLPSVPLRRVVWGVVIGGGLLLAQLGELRSGRGVFVGSSVLMWAAVSLGAVALASGRGRGTSVARTALVAAAFAMVAVVVGGPVFASWFQPGQGVPELLNERPEEANDVLLNDSELDASRRPRLTEQVVMTVEAPQAAFWRVAVYDAWDGRRWTSTEDRGQFPDADGVFGPDPADPALRPDEPGVDLEQTFELQARASRVLPAAATPIAVDASDAVRAARLSDGTLVAADSVAERGTTYSVVSRLPSPGADSIVELGTLPVPDEVAEVNAESPVTTDRVRALATELGAQADALALAAGRPRSSMDVVDAIQRWLSANVTYSLDATPVPPGDDVVDYFLFESEQGWCEQVASAFTVLARLNGVSARVATGFVPGERDPLNGRFTVRERDAHAWSEIYLPNVGWAPFDPTSGVNSVGDQPQSSTTSDPTSFVVALLALVVVLLTARPVARLVRRLASRWRSSRQQRPPRSASWDVQAELDLERRGRAAGRVRGPGETVTTYAGAVAEQVDEADLATVGDRIHRVRFAPPDSDHPS
jgi:transglutaminase-like putative cysteine protease